MNVFAAMTLTDWIVMILVFALIGGAWWLIDDSRKKGMEVGGKFCGGCPHYCRMGKNCDGTDKEPRESAVSPTGSDQA
ncbi:MAG: hypothetical protein IJC59_00785 [Lachnospiraceae bacterium]|nr:hypothetical protein [Lachnospiraceae bacterium]